MGPLARVIYIADKIEVSREGVDPALRELGRTAGLDTLFRAVLDQAVAWLRSRKLDISWGTRRLLSAMEKRKKD
jgi:nicotinate-nucleotide adenylyltransferase